MTDALFEAVRSNMRHIYYNNFIKPGKLCRSVLASHLFSDFYIIHLPSPPLLQMSVHCSYYRDVRLSILQQVHWSSIDKRAVVNYVTKDALLLFVNNFKRHIFIEGLVQGNFTSRVK